MIINSFSIENFKEIKSITPEGIQEEFGVYGDQGEYSTWQLEKNEVGTIDFVDLASTIILYGELYKIRLDTGNVNINQFNNLTLPEYEDLIKSGQFTVNGIRYGQTKENARGLTAGMGRGNPGTGGPGGPGGPGGTGETAYTNVVEFLEYAKESVGWVELNRSRTSFYYESCNNGLVAKTANFYDISQAIITKQTFNVDDINFSPSTYMLDDAQQRIFSVRPTNFSPRLSLTPIGNWIPDEFYYFGSPPHPNVQTLQPNDYLRILFTTSELQGIVSGFGGNVEYGISNTKKFGTVLQNVRLVQANKLEHFNNKQTPPLYADYNVGVGLGYPAIWGGKTIWGQLRLGPSFDGSDLYYTTTIRLSIQSVDFAFLSSDCKKSDTGNEEDGAIEPTISLKDPFALNLYELEKNYQEVYSKYKFCPPKKKVKNDINKQYPFVLSKNPNSISDLSLDNTTITSVDNNINIIPIGAFNPGQSLNIEVDILEHTKKTFEDVEKYHYLSPVYYNRTIKREDATTTNEETGLNDEWMAFDITVTQSAFRDDDDQLRAELMEYDFQSSAFNVYETLKGIRDSNDFLTTSPNLPYGTYKYKIEKSYGKSGAITNIKILQNGSDADPKEFSDAASSIYKTAKNDNLYPEPIGVEEDGLPIFPENTLEESMKKIIEELTGTKEIIFRGSEVKYGAVSYPVYPAPIMPGDSALTYGIPYPIEYVNTGISIKGTVDLNTGEKVEVSNFYNHELNSYSDLDITSDGINILKEKNLQAGCIDFIGKNVKQDLLTFQTDRVLIFNARTGERLYVTKGLEEKFYYNIGWAPAPKEEKPFYWDLSPGDVTHLIISKKDAVGVVKKFWARTVENNSDIEIKSTKTGTLFFKTKGPGAHITDYIYVINGETIEFDTYYKIPVLYSGVTGGRPVPPGGENKFVNFLITYSKNVTSNPPSNQKVVQSRENTYGGWVFSGLWHRDGSWPKEHKKYSGLLGQQSWSPEDGGVNTGAWIKVPRERVRVEFHDFSQNAYTSVYSYIHRKWLKEKDRLWRLQNLPTSINNQNVSSVLTDNIRLSPFDESSESYIEFSNYQPNGLNQNLESWEKDLINLRSSMLESLKSYNSRVGVIFLRDNQADPNRGLSSLENTRFGSGTYDSPTVPGYFLEEWVYANSYDESRLSSKSKYSAIFQPEPTEHTQGFFKKDEWYRAIFRRAITSPSHPSGQISSEDKYTPNEKNKLTLCDIIYASEAILKMHRQRLVDMKKYIDKRSEFYGEIGSDGLPVNDSFESGNRFVKLFRDVLNLYK
jgi:hypothetical protein